MALDTSGVTQTIALEILNVFDMIEHTIGLIHKLGFIVFIESFVSSRRICLV